MRTDAMRAVGVLSMAAMLAACGHKAGQDNAVDALDAELTANAADPALTGALHDQIMVDPALAQQSNDGTVRPPARPASGAMPPEDVAAAAHAPVADEALKSAPVATRDCTQCSAAREALSLGALAQNAAPGTGGAGCAQNISYSDEWAAKLPADVPLYPDARVKEAAGANGAHCALRVVTFSTSASLQHLLDWYYTRTSAAGFSAGHQINGIEHMLAGTRRDGRSFVLFVRSGPDGGATADLVSG